MTDHSTLWFMNILVHDTPVWLSLTLSHRCSSWTAYTRSRAIVCWSQWNSWTPHSPLDPRSAGRGASRWTRKGPSSWPREKCLLPLDLYPRSNSSRCHRYLFRKKNVRFNNTGMYNNYVFLFQALCLNKEFMHYSQCLVCFNQKRDNAIEYEPETELSVPMTIKPQVFVHKDV